MYLCLIKSVKEYFSSSPLVFETIGIWRLPLESFSPWGSSLSLTLWGIRSMSYGAKSNNSWNLNFWIHIWSDQSSETLRVGGSGGGTEPGAERCLDIILIFSIPSLIDWLVHCIWQSWRWGGSVLYLRNLCSLFRITLPPSSPFPTFAIYMYIHICIC